ncbi:MAG: amidohydrolase family protein, partial [Gammaproteobacteria bacterium]|nr:amidohydrolase family protein [Gemmatimonadota bacterium]NIU75279.1 amidohydrolase family protein [Gammaproteobacteria bacterium]
ISLGSDSQARIDPFEEMRAVEYHERLRHGRRNVLVGREAALERLELAPELLAMGTRSGAASLGLDAGALEPGAWADFVEVDLDHPVLSGWSAETLAA